MKIILSQLATQIGAQLYGDGARAVVAVSSIAAAGPTDLVLAQDEAHLQSAFQSNAGAVLAGEFATGVASEKPVLVAANPRLAFARAGELLLAGRERPVGVHPNAVVHSSAKLGKDVGIAPGVVVGPGAAIGDRSRVGAGSHIAGGAVLGADCSIGSNVTIHSQVRLGDRVVVQSGAVLGSDGFGYVRDADTGRYIRFPQVGRLEVGDDVEIGACCTIDRGALDATVIGRGAKLDNLVHVGHNVRIGENVVIAAQTGISGSVVIEDDVLLGGQVGIGDHAVIRKGAALGGQAGVLPHKQLRAGSEPLWGTPAKPLRRHLRELAALARLAKRHREEE